jgi:hypothetical protein
VNAEAPSQEELLPNLLRVFLDLLEEEGFDAAELPVEVVAHASRRARRGVSARANRSA